MIFLPSRRPPLNGSNLTRMQRKKNKTIKISIIFSMLFLTAGFFAYLQAQLESSDKKDKKDLHKQEIITSRLSLRWTLYFTNERGIEVPLQVEVAISDEERARGLMMRETLGKNDGMIFVYKDPDFLSFWMRHTKLPLSIAFIDEKNRIIEIHDLDPYDERIVTSTNLAKYAVEVNRGWFRKNMIFHGDKMRIVQEK